MERNGVEIRAAVKIEGFGKNYSEFKMENFNLEVPAGFITALIGENGAGKSTLLDAIGGITSCRNKSTGKNTITWLNRYSDIDEGNARNEIGWCAAERYFPNNWNINRIRQILPLAFNNFSLEKFDSLCKEFGLCDDSKKSEKKKLSDYSTGNKARLAIASLLARSTDLLIFDEPDAALDPLIREKLNSKFREYINEGNGKTSILFSTHNVADMEKVVDYAVFLSKGKILKEGFVEDLRDKYRFVHGPKEMVSAVEGKAESVYTGEGEREFEALCLTENTSGLSEQIAVEVPSLYQLSLLILRAGEN